MTDSQRDYNECTGWKERDTDHYCWWDQRDWKRQMTDSQRNYNEYTGWKERDTDHYCWWDQRDWKRQMTDSQIHRAERERHWPLLLVRSERLEETDDRLAERLQQIYRVERKRQWPLLLVRKERLEETDDRLAERLNEYIGQKERDTDHYCWWDQRDWKRRTTQTRRGLNPALAYLHCGHWQLWPLPWSLCLSHRGCHWSPGCGHWRWSLLSGGQWLIAALAGFLSAWFDLKQGHHVLKSWDNHRAG